MNKFVLRFVSLWVVNSFALYAASVFYPSYFVLGTAQLSTFAAAAVSGFLLTLLCKLAGSLVKTWGLRKLGRAVMFIYYWAINGVVIWFIAKLAPFSGFGISNFYWAFALGLVINFAQWVARQIFKTLGMVSAK